jgi:protein AaeX
MLREVSLFGALVPSLLLYFLASVPAFLALDVLASRLSVYRLLWHPPLARFGLFVCLFSALSLLS